MPRSKSRVRTNEDPSKCRFSVERITHQPAAWIQNLPPNRLVTSMRKNVVNRIAGLRPKQLELDQTAPAHRGRKEKRHLRFRKGQRRSLVRNQPGDGHHDEKHARTDRFVKPRGAG